MLRVAVIGLGRAGRARLLALDGHPRAALAAVVRTAPRGDERALEAVAADPSIDAAIVCTPNLLHAAQARVLLDAGKHVAVEFPLAPSAREAGALFERARVRERVLHVEHIELLSPGQVAQRNRAAPLGRPLGGELSFSGTSSGWIGDPARAGSPALRAVARLHRLVDLFGEAAVRGARLAETAGGYRLEVRLEFRRGGAASLVEERGPELPRATRWAIPCERGLLDDPPPATAQGGLFRRDLDCFLERIERGAPPYVTPERVLHVLGLVEEIERRTASPGAVPARDVAPRGESPRGRCGEG